MVTLLNTSILTAFGSYRYEPLTLEAARQLVAEGFVSAIGHAGTAEVLGELLGVTVPVNRVDYRQRVGETAIVFKLKRRPPEGVILSAAEVQSIGYELARLTRTQ